ncbi:MAG: methyltransferase [Prevotella sp.]|nr:methyltransferase [Prevotella sp.]
MFKFKQFTIQQDLCAMKVGTDGVLLGAWATGGLKILDVGTGTGVVALMVAQRYPKAQITALDIDEGAVRQAKENVENSSLRNRIIVLHEAVQAHQGKYDAIVSNPPFFMDSLPSPNEQRNIARHSDTLSYADLMQASYRLLKDDGELSVVVPFDYKKRMEDEATFVGFFPHKILGVRTVEKRPAKRYLLSFIKHPIEVEHHIITIGDKEYREMTKDFYL